MTRIRENPKIINASRRQRIARGSGSTVSQVNALVDRFFEARKMMSSMAGRFGMPGGRPSNRKAAKGRKGKRSTGRGPTPPKVKGMPGGFPGLGGGAGLSALPPGMGGAGGMGAQPPAQNFGLDQLPPGFDPSQLKFPKK